MFPYSIGLTAIPFQSGCPVLFLLNNLRYWKEIRMLNQYDSINFSPKNPKCFLHRIYAYTPRKSRHMFFFHFCKGKGKIAPATNWMHSSWNSKKRWKATFCNFTRIMLAGNAIANTGKGNVKRVHICSQTWCTKNVRILRWVQNSVRTWQGSIKNLKWNSQRQLSVPFFV